MDLNEYLKTPNKEIELVIQDRITSKFLLLQDFIGQNIIHETGEIPEIIPPIGIEAFPSDAIHAQQIFKMEPNAGT